MPPKASNKLKIFIFCAVGIALAILVTLYINSRADESENSDDQKISETIYLETTKQKIALKNLDIVQQDDNYARVTITGSEDKKYTAILVKIGGGWQIIQLLAPDQKISCEKAEKIGIPSSFVTDCELEFPKAVTVTEFLDNAGEGNLSDIEQIIGTFSQSEDPNCNCFNLNTGDNSITIVANNPAYQNTIDSLSPGDSVVVNVGGSVSTSTVSAESVLVLQEEIGTETHSPNTNTFQNQATPESKPDPGQDFQFVDYPPDAVLPSWYLLNLLDIDNSNKDIQLIGD